MTSYYWAEHLYNAFTFTVVIPILLGLFRWPFLTHPERWVVVFLVALLLHELLSILCIALHTRNHFLYYLQTVAVLITVAGVYSGTVGTKGLTWQIAIAVSVLMVLEVVFWVGFNHINSVTLSVSRLLPAVYAVVNLYWLFSGSTPQPVVSKPMLYMHLGFFVFGSFTAINAYFKSYFIETSLDLYYLFNNISAMMSAVAFGFFSIVFLQIKSAPAMRVRP